MVAMDDFRAAVQGLENNPRSLGHVHEANSQSRFAWKHLWGNQGGALPVADIADFIALSARALGVIENNIDRMIPLGPQSAMLANRVGGKYHEIKNCAAWAGAWRDQGAEAVMQLMLQEVQASRAAAPQYVAAP